MIFTGWWVAYIMTREIALGCSGRGWNRYDGDHFGTVIWARYPGDSEIRHRWYENTGIKADWNTYLKATFEAGDRISLFADLQVQRNQLRH